MKEAIRSFILEKSKLVFKEKGYHETTIEDIAKSAEVSIPTIYNYFSGKDDVFFNVLKLINSEVIQEMEPLFSEKKPFYTKLEMFIEKIIDFSTKHKYIMRISLYESRILSEMLGKKEKDGFKTLLEMREKKLKILTDFFEDAKKEGCICNDIHSRSLGLILLAILRGYFLEVIFNEKISENRIKKMKHEIITFLKKGIYKVKE